MRDEKASDYLPHIFGTVSEAKAKTFASECRYPQFRSRRFIAYYEHGNDRNSDEDISKDNLNMGKAIIFRLLTTIAILLLVIISCGLISPSSRRVVSP
ncbi:MAG: hypothetical protein ABFS56_21585 [Pseudomonadota bacterium]